MKKTVPLSHASLGTSGMVIKIDREECMLFRVKPTGGMWRS